MENENKDYVIQLLGGIVTKYSTQEKISWLEVGKDIVLIILEAYRKGKVEGLEEADKIMRQVWDDFTSGKTPALDLDAFDARLNSRIQQYGKEE